MDSKTVKRKNIAEGLTALAIVLLLSYVGQYAYFRWDLTSEKRYTLSPTTLELLDSLEDGVFVRIYLDGPDLPLGFKRLRDAAVETLEEFRLRSDRRVDYEVVDPLATADPRVREQAIQELVEKGIVPIDLQERTQQGNSQMIAVPGASLFYQGKELGINLIKNQTGLDAEQNLNNSIQSLEYEFTNAIRKVAADSLLKVALLTGHGELTDKELAYAYLTLSEYYTVERLRLTDRALPQLREFAVAIVAKPRQPFSPGEKFVLDQYLMGGGKLMFFVDGVNISMDSLFNQPASLALSNDIELHDLLFEYGARVNPDLVQDFQCLPIGLTVPGRDGQPQIQMFPWSYFPLVTRHNAGHPVTKYLNPARMEFASSVDTVGRDPLVRKTVLMRSSAFSRQSVAPVEVGLQQVRESAEQSNFRHADLVLGVLLEGQFESAFANRATSQYPAHDGQPLLRSPTTQVLVVGDGDFLRNEVSPQGQPYPLGFDRPSQQEFGGNAEFLANAVNYCCDDQGLMAIRSRELKLRLLNRARVDQEKLFWQALNIAGPLLFLLAFGLWQHYWRRRRFARAGEALGPESQAPKTE